MLGFIPTAVSFLVASSDSLVHCLAGVGRVKQRDNAALWGTDAEPKLRQPDDSFWKKYAAECSRVQIAVDVFIFWCGPAQLPTSLCQQASKPKPEPRRQCAHSSTVEHTGVTAEAVCVCVAISA